MARRRRAEKRQITEDPRYNSRMVSRAINMVMRRGKKSAAEKVIYGALDHLKENTDQDPVEVFTQAIDNVKPRLEVKSRRVGGATYQVPMEVSSSRQASLALRWIIQYSKNRKGVSMGKAMAGELLDAYNGTGAAIKKRDDTHKMAQANKAFAHYRW